MRNAPWRLLSSLLPLAMLVLASAVSASAADTPWKIGVARVKIAPDRPIPMVGYGPRISEGVLDELFAKAIAVESANGEVAVLITADLLFFRRPVADAIAERIMRKTGLSRRQILLTASHTHSGPVVGMTADLDSFAVPEQLRPEVAAYTKRLEQQITDLAVAALADRRPARLHWGVGQSDIAMNRRVVTKDGVVMAPNPKGPVDRSVPVLRADDLDGRPRALLFGCACHPVTLTGENRKISADYAGYAQQAIERRLPGAQAMFLLGCAGDANSEPRGTVEIARSQGEKLAAEVCRVAAVSLAGIDGPLRVEFQPMALPLEQFPRNRLQEMASGPSPWHARNAKAMLQMLDRGEALPTHYSAPLSLWKFGRDLSLVSLPGEAVADYVPLVEKSLGGGRVWVTAYGNESFGYLPTAKILKEGGHETIGLTLDVGFFAPNVEEVVAAKVRDLARDVPEWIVYPENRWIEITPEQAGLDAKKLDEIVARANPHGGTWGGVRVGEKDWGAVLVRGGYLVRRWGDPTFKQPSASLGKCITRALFGLTVEAGLLKPDEPIWKTWTGRGELSHPHKYLDAGLHRQLTWRQLLEHQGGFVLESGYHWRRRSVFHAELPAGVQWTGDPLFDNFAQTPPGATTRYSSAGYWRLSQALTALWGKDLKDVLDERLFGPLGIPADRWDWLPGKVVHDTRDFYPDYPGYGEYVDPPYEIGGKVVRGGPGWFKISPEDLARFGHLIATGGIWKGRRLLGAEWLRGHAGLDIHVVAGDPETMVVIAKTNTKNFPFGQEVGTQGKFSFPKDLVIGPVKPPKR